MAIGDKIYNLEINDSEFEREGWKNARYKGSKLKATQINKFSKGDISFANQPVIEQYSKTVYVFNQSNHSFKTLAGNFYPSTDEFGQTLPDKKIVGAAEFTIDRAVTFEVGNPSNFSQLDPGTNQNEINHVYFDRLIKNDLAMYNSCSVRFFDNENNGFVKSIYTVGHNRGEFKPIAAYFLSASTTSSVQSNTALDIDVSHIQVADIDNGGRLYINPNVETDFTSISGSTDLPGNVPNDQASGSQGTSVTENTAITIDHSGSIRHINSGKGFFYNLSKKINKNNPYFVSFNRGLNGVGITNDKNILNAFDIREIKHSGSNFDYGPLWPGYPNFEHENVRLAIKIKGKNNGHFNKVYGAHSHVPPEEEEYVIFKRINNNKTVHLNFNYDSEAPVGNGNGGIIIPDNLHPKIKEQLNVYLSNAGLGAEGGSSNNFNLGNVTAVTKTILTPSPQEEESSVVNPFLGVTPSGQGQPLPPFEPISDDTPIIIDNPTTYDPAPDGGGGTTPDYGLPDSGNPHTPNPSPNDPFNPGAL